MGIVQSSPNTAAAEALAFVLAEVGFVDDASLRHLEGCEGFHALGLNRDGLAGLIRRRLASIDGTLREHSWLPSDIEQSFNVVLDSVSSPGQRMLVCRLAAAAVQAATHKSQEQQQQLLLEHMLAYWRISIYAVGAGDKGTVLMSEAT